MSDMALGELADVRAEGGAGEPFVVLAEGSREACPVFLVHDAYGDLLLYRQLAQELRGRRVLGIAPPQLGSGLAAFTRIEAMAAHYVRLVRQAWPNGPYLLGGLCAGAIIAAEMALLLESAGEDAALVAVLDAADVEARLRPEAESRPAWRSLLAPGALKAAARDVVGGASRVAPGKVLAHVAELARQKGGALADRAAYLLHDRLGTCPDILRARLAPRKVYDAAERRYRPRGRVRGPVFLIRATTGTGHDRPYAELYEDEALGWRARTTGTLVVSDVPGGHVSLLQPPAVAATGEAVRAACATSLALFASRQSADGSLVPDAASHVPEGPTLTAGPTL
jgi:thioesterase domain-containing protein